MLEILELRLDLSFCVCIMYKGWLFLYYFVAAAAKY
jgi:hypothetical protein